MKVVALIGESRFALEVTREGNRYTVRVEGRETIATVTGQGPFRTIGLGGRAVEASAWRVGAAADSGRGASSWDVAAGGRLYGVRLVDPLRAGNGADDAAHQDGALDIRAVMPGRVVTLLAAEGDEVAKGQGLLVVEAMKMENEIQAPRAGKVTALKVRQGDAVEAGALLATLE